MQEDKFSQTQLRGYLFGQLPTEEQEQIEEAYFTDSALRQELWATFDELTEDFLHDELTATEAQQFATRLRDSPFLRARVENQKRLSHTLEHRAQVPLQIVTQSTSGSFAAWIAGPTIKWIGASIALIGLALSLYWLLAPTPQKIEPQVVQMQPSPASPAPTATPTQSPTPPLPKGSPSLKPSVTAPVVVATFFLLQENFRDQVEAPRLTVLPQTEAIELQLEVRPPFYSRYQVEVQTATGETLSVHDNLTRRQQREVSFIRLRLPVAQLRTTNYVVNLSGHQSQHSLQPLPPRVFQLEKK
jgi:hypothetical protein